jgi:phage antirepressor YoqD-like protein
MENLTKVAPTIQGAIEKLIVTKGGEVRTSTPIMAIGVDNDHKAVIQLVRKYLSDLEEFGRVEFEMSPFETAGGVQEREIAFLNEHQSTLLLTYMRNSEIVRTFKKRLVKAFFELAGSAKPQSSPSVLSRMDLIKMAMEAEQERLLLAAQVEEMQPAVAALERLTESDGTFNVREAAKQLNLKPSQLTAWMGANNWIYKQGAKSPWMAYQPRIDAGLMMHKTTAVEGADGITTIRSQARITAKGLTTISKTIEKANRTAKMLAA